MAMSFFAFLTTLVSTIVALGLAAFVLWCNRRASVNRWLALGLLVLAIHQALVLASRLVLSEPWHITLVRAAFGVLAAMPAIWLGFSLAFGETKGSLRASRWFPVLPCAAFVAFGTTIPLALGRGLQPVSTGTTGLVLIGLDGWGRLLFSVYLLGLVFVLAHIEHLYRNSGPPLRQKLTTLILGIFFALACQIVTTSHTLLFSLIHPTVPFLSASGFLGGQALMAFALVRHRLLDSNMYVSRYVAYRSLTLLLVGGYLLVLGVAGEVFPRLNINVNFLTGSVFALAGAVALALLLLSDKVRWRAKSFIQAHFYRHKYDYREEWMELTRLLSHATTASAIAAQTVSRILQIMWVPQVAIYATEGQSGTLTLLHQVGYTTLPSTVTLSPETLQMLSDVGTRLPSAGRREDSPENRSEFVFDIAPGVAIGHVAPLVAMDKLVGLLVVGPDLSGKPFGVDDKDLLAAVGTQAGAMIVNTQLAQAAADGREVQALARLSAFVTHDLKNSVGMLSLLAENAPTHMHNPEFQADAIRTLTDVTGRMQRLLATFRTSNPEATGRTTQANVAATVKAWLRDLKPQIPTRIVLETRLEPTPDVAMDPEQLRTVLGNLFVNAVEAIPTEGRITVETRTDTDWAVLVVTDTGRGMAADFVRNRLFRPFQTTKPRGLGIGLYQCRDIVQALGGELTAESQEGMGTRMTVRLPAVPSSAQRMETNPKSLGRPRGQQVTQIDGQGVSDRQTGATAAAERFIESARPFESTRSVDSEMRPRMSSLGSYHGATQSFRRPATLK